MSRVAILVLLIAPALVSTHSSHGDETQKKKGNVQVSVRPRSFELSKEEEAQVDKLQPGEDNAAAKAMQSMKEASTDMSQIRDASANVRKAVAELEMASGLNQKSKPQDNQQEQAKSEAGKAKLEELATQRKKVMEMADHLNHRMTEQYAAMFGTEANKAGALMSISEHDGEDSKLTEDEQFAQLEEHTNQMTQWLRDLKELRNERDKLKAAKAAANEAPSVAPAPEQVEVKQQLPEVHANVDHRQHLASVMASSAIEMAQIKSASDDVLAALEELKDWKERDDQSPKSLAEAVKVKAKLAKAMAFLQEHESLVEKRTSQINGLMMDAGMGPL